MKLSRLKTLFFLHLANLPMKSKGWRSRCVKWGGVNIVDPAHTFIGSDVVFDSNNPQLITIETGVTIALRTTIVTHFLDITKSKRAYDHGKIHIGRNAYIGANVIICKPVTIGEGAIVGAGSVVTKDIPPFEVWAGNPARFIKKRDIID